MLMSLKNASHALGKAWLFCGGICAVSLFGFLATMFMLRVPFSGYVMIALAVFTILGMLYGAYVTFYTKFDSSSSLCTLLFVVLTVFVMIGGSSCALAVQVAGQTDLRWLAFVTHVVCLVLALFAGICSEAKALGWWRGNPISQWQKEIEKYIDYSKRQVNPSLTTTVSQLTFKHPYLIIGVGTANIPLLFELYGGGRVNAIFFAAPLAIIIFAYMNFTQTGPALVRILLLRKIEKEVGYRFQNADYEQIQELRRGFFLSRWLMKDYQPQTLSTLSKIPDEQAIKKHKRKRAGQKCEKRL